MLSRSPPPAGFIEPCLPTLAHTVPDGAEWAHEIKHDGYRMISRRDGDLVRVFTRRGHDWTDRVPRIAEALAALRVSSATIDGEAVLSDGNGVADFDRLRGALARRGGSREPFLYAFDLIELNGTDLRRQPWIGRREALRLFWRPLGRRRHRVVRAFGRPAWGGNVPRRLRHGT
jgi:bifunctional non-homologous end joining protein LigD